MTGIDLNSARISEFAPAISSRTSKADLAAALCNSPADRKLRKATAEFESLLLSSLWKSMKSSFADSDDDSTDPAHDTLDNMGVDAMSSAVAKAGGLGLGKLILKHLEPQLAAFQNGKDSASGKAFPPPADIL